MTAYLELSALFRDLICFWSILLILGYTVIIVLSARQKNRLYVVMSSLSVVLLYFIMQVCRNISLWKMKVLPLHPVADYLGSKPFILLVAVLLLFTAGFIIHLWLGIRYAGTHITPTAVKQAMDLSSSGICYYRSDGQPILISHKMNELSLALTGHTLSDGAKFYNTVCDRHITVLSDGTVVRFSHREIMLEGEKCHELITDDITELYGKSQALREDNERLKKRNKQLREYGETIDETVRRQEILNTKKKIHDEMNRLLLSTDNAVIRGTDEERRCILETWQKNILLLCIEADSDTKSNVLSDLNELSKLIGVTLIYDKPLQTQDADTLRLFSLAAEEAMTNAAKHGGASQIFIKLNEGGGTLEAVFSNDGKASEGEIVEAGGLSQLRHCIEKAGGKIEVSTDEGVSLKISIPIGGNSNVL